MPKTIAEKLRITADTELLLEATPEQRALLGPLPQGVVVDRIRRDTSGTAVAFAGSREELDALLTGPLTHLHSFRAAWIAYRKGGRSDINRDSIWTRVQEVGWTLTANIAVSEEWSAVRLKRAE